MQDNPQNNGIPHRLNDVDQIDLPQQTDILDSITDAFLLLDQDWRFIYLNAQAARLLDCSDLLGCSIWQKFPEAVGSQFEQEYRRAVVDRVTVNFEAFYPPHQTWYAVRAYPTSFGLAVCFQNINDRKQQEALLLEQQQLAQKRLSEIEAIYTTAPVGLCFIDTSLRFVRINNRLAEINGFPVEAHLGRTLRDILPVMADNLEPLYQQVIQTQVPIENLEVHGANAAQPGVERDWLLSLYPVVAANGTVLGINAMVNEITGRKQTEAALAQTNIILQAVIEGASDVIFVKDRQGRYVIANSMAASWLNTLPEAMLGQDDTALFPPTIAQQIMQLDQQVIQSGDSILYEEQVPKQGTMRSLLSAKYPWRDAESNIQGIIGISRDISEFKAAEAALRQSEERYLSLFESIDDGFCIVEMLFDQNEKPIDYRFLEVNPAFERQSGLVEAQGKTARQLLPDLEAHWFEIYGDVAQTGEACRFEHSSEVMNRWFEVFAFRFGAPEQRQVAIRFKDITERKRAELEREQLLSRAQAAQAEAERANRIKDDFLAVLSHELRTPLNPILGWAKLLQEGKLDAQSMQKALSTIERNVKLQTQLIDDLLDISRILRGKLTLDSAPVNLATVIEAAIDTVRLAANAKSMTIHTDFDPAVGKVLGDAGRLQQVLWNLLTNAVKFTPNNGRVEVRLAQVGTEAQIQVIDTGKGISPEFLPQVFDRFQQADSSITRQFGGLGLGLAIARQLVELHGGTIVVESQGEGQGAMFTVRLPLAQAGETAIVESSNPGDFAAALDRVRVLVVDDEADSRDLVQFILQHEGAIVTLAASASEALQLLEQAKFDCVVSDIGMPEGDGYSLLQQIRAEGSAIPAIALTAFAGELNQEKARRAGFDRHLSKPLDPESLIAAIAGLRLGS